MGKNLTTEPSELKDSIIISNVGDIHPISMLIFQRLEGFVGME